ncbi:MAG: hypothetical protein ABIT70_09230 [Sulfuriferula sp.]
MPQPEQQARKKIDQLLARAGWRVCDADVANNIHATGVIEAKKEGVTLTGVETQSDKYPQGLPAGLPRWGNPLSFAYPSTGVGTRFTYGFDCDVAAPCSVYQGN